MSLSVCCNNNDSNFCLSIFTYVLIHSLLAFLGVKVSRLPEKSENPRITDRTPQKCFSIFLVFVFPLQKHCDGSLFRFIILHPDQHAL